MRYEVQLQYIIPPPPPHPYLLALNVHPSSFCFNSFLTNKLPSGVEAGVVQGAGYQQGGSRPAFFSSDHFICYKPPILQHQIIGVQAAPRVLGERVTAPPLPYKRCSRTVHLTLSPGCRADPKALFLLPNLCSYGLE